MTTKKAKIFYIHPCDIRATRKEKFDYLLSHKFQDIPFEQITPDKNNNWINLTDNDWDDLKCLITKNKENSIISEYSNGVSTNRDEWVYDLNIKNLDKKINYFIDSYNLLIEEKNNEFPTIIKWSSTLKSNFISKNSISFDNEKIISSAYRPYVKYFFYCEKILNDRLTEFHYEYLGLNLKEKNKCIALNFNDKYFFCLSSKFITDLHFTGDTKCLPLYRYDKSGNRIENITDWGLEQFVNHYSNLPDFKNPADLSKEDIFHYVYGVLHNPVYRKKYELNLKREFPRIPFYKDFWKWANWGKELMELHINYEIVEPYQLAVSSNQLKTKKTKEQELNINNLPLIIEKDDFIPKAKLKTDKENGIIILDEITSLSGVPKTAWEYKLGIRSAMEWILDQYKEKTPRDPTIREKFNTYKFADYKETVIDLLKRVCTVSVRTVEIMKEMEKEGE